MLGTQVTYGAADTASGQLTDKGGIRCGNSCARISRVSLFPLTGSPRAPIPTEGSIGVTEGDGQAGRARRAGRDHRYSVRFPGARDPAEFHDLAVTGRRMFQPVRALPGRPPVLTPGWPAGPPSAAACPPSRSRAAAGPGAAGRPGGPRTRSRSAAGPWRCGTPWRTADAGPDNRGNPSTADPATADPATADPATATAGGAEVRNAA